MEDTSCFHIRFAAPRAKSGAGRGPASPFLPEHLPGHLTGRNCEHPGPSSEGVAGGEASLNPSGEQVLSSGPLGGPYTAPSSRLPAGQPPRPAFLRQSTPGGEQGATGLLEALTPILPHLRAPAGSEGALPGLQFGVCLFHPCLMPFLSEMSLLTTTLHLKLSLRFCSHTIPLVLRLSQGAGDKVWTGAGSLSPWVVLRTTPDADGAQTAQERGGPAVQTFPGDLLGCHTLEGMCCWFSVSTYACMRKQCTRQMWWQLRHQKLS